MANSVKTIDDLNEEKQLALVEIKKWFDSSKNQLLTKGKLDKPFFYLAGYAGTGKTTLIKFLSPFFSTLNIGFATYTGKAASVLAEKGIEDPTTIHSLIYKVEFDDDTGLFTFALSDESEITSFDLVVLDEVSMINEELGKDLISFKIPLLVVGDEGQLPPVHGTGYFTKNKPDFNLEEIHRQALESGIIQLSVDVRLNNKFDFNSYRNKFDDVIITNTSQLTNQQLANFDLVAVGMHKTRRNIIKRVRQFKGEGAYPQAGSKIVFTRNNKVSGLMNGHIKDVIAVKETSPERLKKHLEKEIKEFLADGKDRIAFDREKALKIISKHPELHKRFLNVKVEIDGVPKWTVVYLGEFYEDATGKKAEDMPLYKESNRLIRMLGADYACYAYALTVHKLQGSQGHSILFIDDGFATFAFGEETNEQFQERVLLRKRWLYTGITRAVKTITIAI